MIIKCTNKSCGKEWNYKGKNKHTATCPDCRLIIKLKGGKEYDKK